MKKRTIPVLALLVIFIACESQPLPPVFFEVNEKPTLMEFFAGENERSSQKAKIGRNEVYFIGSIHIGSVDYVPKDLKGLRFEQVIIEFDPESIDQLVELGQMQTEDGPKTETWVNAIFLEEEIESGDLQSSREEMRVLERAREIEVPVIFLDTPEEYAKQARLVFNKHWYRGKSEYSHTAECPPVPEDLGDDPTPVVFGLINKYFEHLHGPCYLRHMILARTPKLAERIRKHVADKPGKTLVVLDAYHFGTKTSPGIIELLEKK